MPEIFTYSEAVEYLFSKLPMYSRTGAAAYTPNLNKTLLINELLGQPHRKITTIHVAGTNGKGSVSHLLAAVFQEAGYKTGLYTSPHLKDFRERIKINGKMIAENEVITFVQKYKQDIETLQPNFFELTTNMALYCFALEQVDIAIIETGLGGRLDSTNIINPIISIITNIGLDHVNILGNSLPEIAFEKAGIIKENTPVVIGTSHKETMPVFIEVAQQKKAPIEFADKNFSVRSYAANILFSEIEIIDNNTGEITTYQPDLMGIYQQHNLVTVLATLKKLKAIGYDVAAFATTAFKKAAKITGLHGRWQRLGLNPGVFADVAHNEDGMRQLLQQIAIMPYKQLHIILGMVKDKDVKKVLSLMPHQANYYFTRSGVPRALAADVLQEEAAKFQLQGSVYGNVNQALAKAKIMAHEDDLIVICGSVFLVGEIDGITNDR